VTEPGATEARERLGEAGSEEASGEDGGGSRPLLRTGPFWYRLGALAKGPGERAIGWTAFLLSAVVVGLVAVLIAVPGLFAGVEGDVSALPAFHATLNGTTALLLLAGWIQIRRGRPEAHRALMGWAFALSTLFLVSYVVYHAQAEPVSFGGEGWIRPLYVSILISHVVLAPVVLPLALYAVLRALRDEFGRHRRVARWTFPLWLYVAVTGVLVYLFMRPYY